MAVKMINEYFVFLFFDFLKCLLLEHQVKDSRRKCWTHKLIQIYTVSS